MAVSTEIRTLFHYTHNEFIVWSSANFELIIYSLVLNKDTDIDGMEEQW